MECVFVCVAGRGGSSVREKEKGGRKRACMLTYALHKFSPWRWWWVSEGSIAVSSHTVDMKLACCYAAERRAGVQLRCWLPYAPRFGLVNSKRGWWERCILIAMVEYSLSQIWKKKNHTGAVHETKRAYCYGKHNHDTVFWNICTGLMCRWWFGGLVKGFSAFNYHLRTFLNMSCKAGLMWSL